MKNIVLLFLLLLFQLPAFAQKSITVEDFTTKTTFTPRIVTGINWMKDGKFYSALDDNKVIKYDITTGLAVETLVDGNALNPKIEIEDYSFSADENKVLLVTDQQSIYRWSFTAEYYVHDRVAKSTTKLSQGGRQSIATFSPDGSRVGFVRANNVFYVTLKDMSETQVTDDGKFNYIINGTTDWVYEEEFSFINGFFWSPDSKKIAYYRFDESAVKEFDMTKFNHGQLYPENYKFKYPKAGEANSVVEIWTYNLDTKAKVKANLGEEKDIYIPRVMWTKDANVLSVRKLNRLQNTLEIFHVNANDGKASLILTEKRPTYVDIEFIDDLTYLDDGKQFIHSSEASGYKHFYLYSITGALVKQITTGDFEVSEFIGFDQKSKIIYFTSKEVSPMEKHLFSVTLDGRKKIRMTPATGSHTINMSPDCQFYIDHHGSSNSPIVASLYKTKGNALIKVIEKNEKLAAAVEEYGIADKEFFTCKANDGTVLNGFMLKPNDFDAKKSYPLIIYQYSGPGSQNVNNAWAGTHFYFHQLLAQKGYIVAVIDTRGTGGRGESFKKMTYKQLGKHELEDILSTAKYLGGLDYIDETRMGVWGWSYGGYMSSLAMTKGGGVFKVGIAVAPVANWRFYDTVYTERFLQKPQDNPEGYDLNSPATYIADLKGKFLLVHGTGDDNVHFQNSVLLQEGLINAGIQFESFYYPDKNHSILGAKTKFHLYTMMTNFFVDNL